MHFFNTDIFSTLLVYDIFLFILIGFVAGAFSGLLGIGGGTILVPIFLYALPHYLPPAIVLKYLHHIAVATSIACIFLTACVSGLSHVIKKFVPEKRLYFLAAGSLCGAYLNTRYLFLHVSGASIHVLFIVFLWINIYFLFKNNKNTKNNAENNKDVKSSSISHKSHYFLYKLNKLKILLKLKNLKDLKYFKKVRLAIYFIVGALIATVASTIGLGGGFMVVPLLLRLGFGMHLAIASSIMNGIALAIGSLFAYYELSLNMGEVFEKSHMLGFIYMPALLIIAPIACVTAFFATRMAYRIPHLFLKRLFAGFLIFVSVILLFQ